MRALVTGAAGFIGSNLTISLLADGHEVIGLDAFTRNYNEWQKQSNIERARDWDDFELLRADLSDMDLGDLTHSCDTIFHLAAEPGVRPSWGTRFSEYLRNNLLATQRLLESLKAHPGPRMVFASSSSVYGDAERFPTPESTAPEPASPYGVTKLAAERLCGIYRRNYGVDTLSLRY